MKGNWYPPNTLLELLYIFYYHSNVIMSAMASQITGISIVYSTVCLGTDQRKHQSSVSPAFVRGIQWWPVNSLHKGPVTKKMFSFDDVVMGNSFSAMVYCSKQLILCMIFSSEIVSGWFRSGDAYIQYIPRNMHTVLLCFALLWLRNRS